MCENNNYTPKQGVLLFLFAKMVKHLDM